MEAEAHRRGPRPRKDEQEGRSLARERRRLLIAPERLAEEVLLTAAEAHYLSRVLRLTHGQGCEVVDGAGRRWGALLEGSDRLRLEQAVSQPLEVLPPRTPPLLLAVALPRQDSELIWRMATELGVDQLQPLQADRGVVRSGWPEERWRTILREATEQCERLWLPELHPLRRAAEWFTACSTDRRFLASSRGAGLPHLLHCLQTLDASALGDNPVDPVVVAIGPEGGWSTEEEVLAGAQGWIPVTAGPTILRTTTAAVTVAAWLTGWREGVSSSADRGQSP